MVAEREAPTKPKRHRVSRRPRSEVCPNCGHPIAINFCPNCGQHASDHNSSVWGFVVEFFDEFLQVDSKFLRTLGALVRKPGYLTQEWCQGKRASYISPLKLFIAINALFFLAMGVKFTADQGNFSVIHFNQPSEADQKLVQRSVRTQSWLGRSVTDMVAKMRHSDPAAVRQEFMNRLPTASLLLIPVLAFVFCALYIRRDRYYLEHIVFLLHVNSFCLVTFGVAMYIPLDWVIPVVLLWHLIYVYAAMKRNYGQGWIKTFFKFWLFGAAFTFLVLMAIVTTAMAAAFLAPAIGTVQSANQDNSASSTSIKANAPDSSKPKQPAPTPSGG